MGSEELVESRQTALARSRAYALFSHLYLYGLTAGWLPTVRLVPELSREVPAEFDADQCGADHQHLFGFNVFPYQSFFLDPTGLLGGEVTDGVLESYSQMGYRSATTSESPDHIGQELGALAFLAAAEAEARDATLPEVARRMSQLQQQFLSDQLLVWLPPLMMAIRQQAQPFYIALANLTQALVLDHWHDYAGDTTPAFALADPPDLLEDDRTGLREIAGYLLTPPFSGIYLSRDDIGRLARRQEVPRGFGDRKQMLVNLLRAAAAYDGLEELLADMVALAERWINDYEEMGAGPWRERAARTRAFLVEIANRARQYS